MMNKNFVVKLLMGAIVVDVMLAISFANTSTNSITNAGAACGFAIASGLGLISVAMLYREQ